MFRQQRTAAGYVPHQQLGLLLLKLRHAGYVQHDGPAVARDGEIATLRKVFNAPRGLRQNHVQIVNRGSTIGVYAHTEPHTDRFLAHAASAIFDEASFAGGSKMLNNDLAAVGFALSGFGNARRAAR